MRAVVQRVRQAHIEVAGERIASIARGLLVLLGVEQGDMEQDARYLAEKTVGLRIFADENDLMNLSVSDCQASILVVSQFTLLGDVRRGRRPSFITAAEPTQAHLLYESYCQRIAAAGIQVGQGRFQTDMQVSLINDGLVTILLDSRKRF